MVYLYGLMEENMKDNGKEENNMARAYILLLPKKKKLEYGRKVKDQDGQKMKNKIIMESKIDIFQMNFLYFYAFVIFYIYI